MLRIRLRFFCWLTAASAAGLTFHPLAIPAATSNLVRIAVGPFFAPALDKDLTGTAQFIPELLTAELSHTARFQLVEREKIQTVWSELNLNAGALVGRDSVAKLGHLLACDWLISGTLVQANGRVHVWTKVIDVRDGTVVDLNVTPWESAVSNVVKRVASFLDQASLQPRARQFVTLGPIRDMNSWGGTKREDWSQRLAALIEKHSLQSGYGVAELAAVGPIFEERRLETAGLTGHPEGRVRLQAAFWLVDGGWEWVDEVSGSSRRLAVGLRVQRVGGPEQMFRFTNSPGPEIERELTATLTRALANPEFLSAYGPDAEAALLAARGDELVHRRSPFETRAVRPKTAWDHYKQDLERWQTASAKQKEVLATYERTLLRDPENLEVKTRLGSAYLFEADAGKREHGKELLQQVVAAKHPAFSGQAAGMLTNAAIFAQVAQSGPTRPVRPKDWDSLRQAYTEDPVDLEIKSDFGVALLSRPDSMEREQGRRLLEEVAAGDRVDLAERARKVLNFEPVPRN